MTKPRILTVDLETAPSTAYVWSLKTEYVPVSQVIEPGRIICWAAKFLGERKVYYHDERLGPELMFNQIHALLSEADAVVSYNGDKFDLPKLAGQFVRYGLPPLPPVTSIDLLKAARKFGLLSNRLEFVGPYFDIGRKIKNAGFSLWTECMAGNPKAWDKMRRYNMQDVRLTEAVYRRFAPYIANHPRLYPKRPDRPSCRECGSTRVHFKGQYSSRQTMYDRFVCVGCGAWDKVPRKVK